MGVLPVMERIINLIEKPIFSLRAIAMSGGQSRFTQKDHYQVAPEKNNGNVFNIYINDILPILKA